MNNNTLITQPKYIIKAISFAACVILFTGIAACSGKYGSFQRDKEVYYAFENKQVSPDYKYFSNHQHNVTYAIVGIDPKYKLESKIWREITSDTEDFKKSVNRIWDDFGYYPYGANILDPTGNKMGIYYSAVLIKTIKFLEDNQIEVMINTPYLWGEDEPGGIRVAP
jgi:hypothetical protein